jgi:hypothetical protein
MKPANAASKVLAKSLRERVCALQVPDLPCSMDQEQASRRLAQSHRLLTEGRARIERQRAIIARLEQLRIDSAKQVALLTWMLEAQDRETQRAVELLDWLQANPAVVLGP